MIPPVVWAIVVAAGRGVRFGGAKHDLILANGQRVIDMSLASAAVVAEGIVVVTSDGNEQLPPSLNAVPVLQVAGGDTRTASVKCGLAVIPLDAEIIVVHDAARPLASSELFSSVIHEVIAGSAAAIPGIAVTDTIKSVEDGRVGATLDRASLVAVQTPQAFRADVLRKAYESGLEATDDAGLVEQMGLRVEVVAGEARNLKLTTPDDLAILNNWLSE
jgi:2-C-methyl-D-erythritol 4-phosphate cytidylyltransferase